MKFTTKLKIVHWIEKLLGLAYAPIPVYKEEKQIQIARFQKIYQKEEIDWMENHNSLELAIKQHLIFSLNSTAIKITKIDHPENNKILVTGELKFIYP